MQRKHLAIRFENMVLNRGCRSQKIEPKFTLQALLHNLHMEQSQKTYTKAKTECMAVFSFIHESGVIQGELCQRILQLFVLVGLYREQAGINHRLNIAITRKGLLATTINQRDRVANLHLRRILQTRHQIADFAHAKFITWNFSRTTNTNLFYQGMCLGSHHANVLPLFHGAIDDANQSHDTTICIKIRVEDQSGKRRIRITYGMRNVIHDRLKQIVYAYSRFSAGQHCIVCRDSKAIFDFRTNTLRFCGGKINLVDKRNNFQVRIHGHHGICDCLSLDTLGSIHDKYRALASSEGTRDFIREVNMTWGVDKIEMIELPIISSIIDTNRLAFDGNTAFALDVHRIEHLFLHVAL